MPTLSSNYPAGLPGFISGKPAPVEWQKRIQTLDENLWIAWNPVDPDGARWSVMRWHGQQPHMNGGVLIDVADHGAELVTACGHGWSFVGPLQDREGQPCGLTDAIVDAMRARDGWRRYGSDKESQKAALAKEAADLVVARQAEHDKLMDDAWADTQADHVITRNRTAGLI